MLKNPLRVYDDITGAIGQTPMIRLNKVTKEHNIKCQVYAKCDFFSAGGSSKDRIGLTMIDEAEKRGTIKPGDTICEGTSGNTGIGLVLTGIVRGYNTVIAIPDKMSDEKINLLKGMGAKVIVTPTGLHHDHPDSYTSIPKRMGEQPNHFYIAQYDNLDNRLSHELSTTEEIWEQMEGKMDYVFICSGTCGTISGVGKGLHKKDESIKIVGVDPQGSVIARPVELNGPSKMYKIEGIGQNPVPKNMNYDVVNDWVKTDDEESFVMARDLIQKEGLLVGGSCGSAVIGAFKYLKEKGLDQNENLKVVIFLPDAIRNYMSKFLSDAWMVGNGFYPTSKLQNPEHPLDNLFISNLKNLQPIPYYDARLTVNDCFDLFKKGHAMIPIRANGAITGVVTKNSLSRTVVDKKLHGMSSATHCTQLHYLKVPYDTPLSVISTMLKTEDAILAIKYTDNQKIRSIYVVTHTDILDSLHENLKEVI